MASTAAIVPADKQELGPLDQGEDGLARQVGPPKGSAAPLLGKAESFGRRRPIVTACAAFVALALFVVAIILIVRKAVGTKFQYQACIQPGAPIPVPRLEDMTLAEKVGQMAQIEHTSLAKGQWVETRMLGSVLSGGGKSPATGIAARNWFDLTNNMQSYALRTRLRIPMVYAIDAVHGHNNVYGATIFPHNVNLGAADSPELARLVAGAAAEEIYATGIRWTFAPAVSVCTDPRWGRCYEAFGEDPALASRMAAPAVRGYQNGPKKKTGSVSGSAGSMYVAATAKHFLADGATSPGTGKVSWGLDQGDARISREELLRWHLPPYNATVAADVAVVMISYSAWNGVRMHGNQELISGVLKGELNFSGVVLSDWSGVDTIPGSDYSEQVRKAVNAGIDMVMVPKRTVDFVDALTAEVTAGNVPLARVDDAVSRILRLKEQLGLFQAPCADVEGLGVIGKAENREIARRAARESLVLLKNQRRGGGGALFPLRPAAGKLWVVGSHADNLGFQCGGWTITWQGGSGATTKGTTLLAGIQAALGPSAPPRTGIPPAGAGSGTLTIVAVGEEPYAEFLGDRLDISMSAQAQQTIRDACAASTCLVIVFSGRPLTFEEDLLNKMDGFIAAFLPGSEGGAGIADALFGRNGTQFDFGGRLPLTWPRQSSVLPMWVGSDPTAYDPLFPFGFGLNKAGARLNGTSLVTGAR